MNILMKYLRKSKHLWHTLLMHSISIWFMHRSLCPFGDRYICHEHKIFYSSPKDILNHRYKGRQLDVFDIHHLHICSLKCPTYTLGWPNKLVELRLSHMKQSIHYQPKYILLLVHKQFHQCLNDRHQFSILYRTIYIWIQPSILIHLCWKNKDHFYKKFDRLLSISIWHHFHNLNQLKNLDMYQPYISYRGTWGMRNQDHNELLKLLMSMKLHTWNFSIYIQNHFCMKSHLSESHKCLCCIQNHPNGSWSQHHKWENHYFYGIYQACKLCLTNGICYLLDIAPHICGLSMYQTHSLDHSINKCLRQHRLFLWNSLSIDQLSTMLLSYPRGTWHLNHITKIYHDVSICQYCKNYSPTGICFQLHKYLTLYEYCMYL